MSKQDIGKIVQIVGVVIDVEFDGGKIPAIYDAMLIERGGKTITLEVAQHLDEHTVRSIALSSTDGLKRGQEVKATGSPIQVPVGEETQGRMFNVTGDPIDGKPAQLVKKPLFTARHQALWNSQTRRKFLKLASK